MKSCTDNSSKLTGPTLCRICMEDSEPSLMLAPCLCCGSAQFVHETCLKTWLSATGLSKCEICQYEFEMVKREGIVCVPSQMCSIGMTHCLFIPLLIGVFFMLTLIVYVLIGKVLTAPYSSPETEYAIALIITSSCSGLILLGLVFHSIKEACTTRKITQWTINNANNNLPTDVNTQKT